MAAERGERPSSAAPSRAPALWPVHEQPVPLDKEAAAGTLRCLSKRTPITGQGCADSYLFSHVAKADRDRAPCVFCPAGAARARLLRSVEREPLPLPGSPGPQLRDDEPVGSHPQRRPRGIKWAVQPVELVDVAMMSRHLGCDPAAARRAAERAGRKPHPAFHRGRPRLDEAQERAAWLTERIAAAEALLETLRRELAETVGP